MRITESCSWCHTMVDAEQKVCPKCGHDAHVARVDCGCYSCTCFPVRAAGTQKAAK